VNSVTRIVLMGSVAIVLFDTIGSVAALVLQFDYPSLSPISFAIYAVIGYMTARGSIFKYGVLGAAVVAFVDATIGWAISWAIGPGRLPGGQPAVVLLLVGVAVVTATGAFFGFVGAGVAALLKRQAAA
jgi:hypothetical protein